MFFSVAFRPCLWDIRGMKKQKTTIHVGASLNPAYAKALKDHAQKTGLSVSRVIENALHRYLKVKQKPGLREKPGRKPTHLRRR